MVAQLGVTVDVLADGDELGCELLGEGRDLLLKGGGRGGGGSDGGSRAENDDKQGRKGENTAHHGFLLAECERLS